jgi:uncharacterized membrane protein
MGDVMTAETVSVPGRPGKPVQVVALAGCSIVLLMTSIALANWLFGGAPWPARIQSPAAALHFGISMLALPLTIAQLARRKGTRPHRMIGYAWCGLLMGGALASFFVHELTGGFSPPHLFAITTVIVVPWIIYAALTRRRKTHRNLVLVIAFTQILAGALTFIPERHSIGDLFWVLWS